MAIGITVRAGVRFLATNFTVFFFYIYLHIPCSSCAHKAGPSFKLIDLKKIVGPKRSKNHHSILKKGMNTFRGS